MALEIFRLVGSVFVDTAAANDSLKKTDQNAEGVGTKLLSAVKTAGKFGAAVYGAAVTAGGAMVALTETTREYRVEQGKLLTAYESNGFAAENARATYAALNGVLGDSGQAVEASNHLALLCETEEELQMWTNICTGVYGTFGASLPIEGLTEAANETAKTGALTGSLADALNWAGVNEDAFQASLDKCSTEQERNALITQTLNGLYTEAADVYRENNAEVIAANMAQDKLNATMANIGGILEPVITKGKEVLVEVLEKVTPYINTLAQTVIPFLMDSISQLVDWVDSAIQIGITAAEWFKTHENLATVLAIAVGTLAVAVGVYTGAQSLMTATTTLATAATTAFGAVMAFVTSPITLVVAAIGACIAVGVLLIKNWDSLKAKAVEVWEGIKSTYSGVSAYFSGVFGEALNKVKGLWSGLTGWFEDLMDGIIDVVDGIGDGLAAAFKAPVNGVITLINRFIGGLNGIKIPDWVPEVGGKTFSIAKLPYLESGGVLERGQVGLLEGNGAEAVVPLERNQKWISAVARDMRASGIGGDADVAQQLLDAFLDFVEELPRVLNNANGEQKLVVNNREFARLVKAVV